MEDHQLDLTPDELATIEETKKIVGFEEQTVRSDHPHLQVVRFTVRAPQASIAEIRKELAAKVYVDESEPPEQATALPMKG